MQYKSEKSEVTVNLTFYNKCPEDVELFWHNFEGELISYGMIPTGAEKGKDM